MLYGANGRFLKKKWPRNIDCRGLDFRQWRDSFFFERVAPTWQLFRSCEADTALLAYARELYDNVIDEIARRSPEEVPSFLPEDIWETIGRIWPDRSHFVEPIERWNVTCTS